MQRARYSVATVKFSIGHMQSRVAVAAGFNGEFIRSKGGSRLWRKKPIKMSPLASRRIAGFRANLESRDCDAAESQ